jgi:uncharacterized membrane protein
MKRIQSIDIVRGLVMIIMILDHVRDFFHEGSITQNPTDLATTTPALFFTRWITHLCAPAFVFLAGVSAFQKYYRWGDKRGMKQYLLKRGLQLLLLEFTVVNFGLWFDIGFHTIIFEVIGAISLGFISLSLLLNANKKILLAIAGLILVAQQVLSLIPLQNSPVAGPIVSALFRTTVFELGPGRVFVMGYPPVPWIAILLLGYSIAPVFLQDDYKKKLRITGIIFLLSFVFLRLLNIYGDPVPWQSHPSELYTFLSFMNVSKYPPSLLFTLVTLGIVLIMLSFSHFIPSKVSKVLQVYGKEPLFFFLLHWYIIHPAMLIMLRIKGFSFSDMNFGAFGFGRPASGAGGVSLPWVYLVWILTVILFYPLCKWYHKRTKTISSAPRVV